MPSVRFTFEAQDKDVQALLGRIQQALHQVRAEEEGAANEFSAIAAGARAALAAAQEQVSVARQQVEEARQRAVAEVNVAKAARDSAVQVASIRAQTAREALVNARETARLAIEEARNQLATAQQVTTARRQSLQTAQQEEQVIRRQTAARVESVRDEVVASRRRLEDARFVLNAMQLAQRRAESGGTQSQGEAAEAQRLIQAQRENVELLKDQVNEKKRLLDTAKKEATEARAAARANVEAARSELNASKQVVRGKQEELRAAQAAGAAQVRAAQQAASATVQSGRASVQAANQQVAAARVAANAQVNAAQRGLAQARAQQANAQATLGAARAQQQLARAQQAASTAGAQHADVVGRLTNRLISLFAAVQGAQLFARFINEGLKFDQVLETATLAIASLVDAESNISLGERPVRDMEKLAVAIDLSREQMVKLRVAGLQTAATTEQLVDAFQQAVGAGTAAGLTLDQIRVITIQITQAAAALGVPMNQINQEVRSILDATIDRNSRVARVLGITNAQVRAMKEQHQLFGFLNNELKAFTDAGVKAADTFQVIKSNMREALDVFAGSAVQPLFDNLKKGFQGALNALFDFNTAQVNSSFSGLIEGLQKIFGKVGEILADAIAKTISGAQTLGEWFRANRAEVSQIVDEIDDMLRAIFKAIAAVVKLGVEIGKWSIELHIASALFRTITETLQLITGIVHILTNGWGLLALAITGVTAAVVTLGGATAALEFAGIAILVHPFIAAAIAIAALTTAVNFFIARNEALKRQQEEITKQFVDQTNAVGDLTVEYAKLAEELDRINENDPTTDVAEASEKLIGIANKLAQADVRYAILLKQKNNELQRNANVIRVLRETYQSLILEQDKLNAGLKDGTLTGQAAVDARTRLVQISAALKLVEEQNTAAVLDQKGKFHDLLVELKKVADARVAEAEATLKQAQAALVLLKAQAEADKQRRKQEGTPPGRAGEAKLARDQQAADEFQQGINAVETQVTRLELALTAAKTKRDELAKALLAPPIRVTPRERPDDRNTKSKLENDARQFMQAELTRIKAQLDLDEATLKQRFAEHKVAIKQYYDGLLLINEIAIEDEIKAHQKLLTQLSDPGDRKREQAAIAALKQKELELVHEFNTKELEDTKQLQAQVERARVDLLEAQGHTAEAQIARIRAQFAYLKAALEAEVRAGTPGSQQSLDLVNQLLDANIFKIRLQEVRDLIAKFKTDVSEQVQDIANRVQAGALSQNEAAKETVKVYQDVIFELESAKLHYKVLADALKDPAAQKALQLLQAAINSLQGPLRAAIDATHQFRNAIFDALQNSLSQFLSSGIDQAKSFGDAFRAMALSVVNSLRQIIAQILAYKIAAAIFGAVGVGVPAAAKPPGAKSGGLITPLGPTMPAFRDGGMVTGHIRWINSLQDMPRVPRFGVGGPVRGPGTGTSDSITAKLSHGEYVIRAAKVRELGVEFFDEINFGKRGVSARKRKRAFADGGSVDATGGGSPGGSDSALNRLEIALQEGLEARLIKSRPGRRSVLQVIQEHPNEVNKYLGRKR